MGAGAYHFPTASTVLGVILEVDTGADAHGFIAVIGWRWEWLNDCAVGGAQGKPLRALGGLLSECNRGQSEKDGPGELHNRDKYVGERTSD